MNEMQKAAIENLQKTNQKFIFELTNFNSKLILEYQKYDGLSKDFTDLMNEMELASGQLPVVPYNNAYAIENGDFCRLSAPLIRDAFYGTMDSQFRILSNQWMEATSLEFEKRFSELKSVLQTNVNKLNEVLTDVIACNSITHKLERLHEKFSELEAIANVMWYPKAQSEQKYAMKGKYIPPINLSPAQIQMRYPFHRELLIRFEYLLKTKELHPNAIDKCIGVLKYINNYLPFAELITETQSEKVVLNNYFIPSQTQIGSDNEFDGNINIGNE